VLELELHPANSAANLVKRGIDFVAAQFIWMDTHRIEVPARTTDEPRWMVVKLDREAARLGVTRQSPIKVWIAEKLDDGDQTAA
jgi:uncharacterized DUF497 family protein